MVFLVSKIHQDTIMAFDDLFQYLGAGSVLGLDIMEMNMTGHKENG